MNRFLFCIAGVLLFMLTSCTPMEKELYLFVGTYAKESEPGIFLYRFNTEDGTAIRVSEIFGIGNPSYLALSKDEKFLYSVSESAASEAKVYAYAFDKKTGKLCLADQQKTESDGPCYIWVGSKQKLAVTANYTGGSISAFPLLPEGRIDEAAVYVYEGGTPESARQKAPHLHCIYASPDEKFLYANDLGTDRIYKYELSPDEPIISDNSADVGSSGTSDRLVLKEGVPSFFSLPAGEGPRHTTFHPNGRFAYLIGELSGRVAVLKYDDGNLTPIQYIEADSLHAAGSADIHVTPDGRFLYASNRLKGDGLAIFSIDPESGRLTKIGYQSTGIHPRNFIITPNGKFLLCACRNSHVIQVFAIDQQSGLLTDIQKDIKVNQPVCLKFAGL